MIKRVLLFLFLLLVCLAIIFIIKPKASTSHTFTKGDDAYIAFMENKDTLIDAIEKDKQLFWRSYSITGSIDTISYHEARLSIEVFSIHISDIDNYVENLMKDSNVDINVDLVILPFPEKALISGRIQEVDGNNLYIQSSNEGMMITLNEVTIIEDGHGRQKSLSYLQIDQEVEVYTRHEALDENEGNVLAEKIKVISN